MRGEKSDHTRIVYKHQPPISRLAIHLQSLSRREDTDNQPYQANTAPFSPLIPLRATAGISYSADQQQVRTCQQSRKARINPDVRRPSALFPAELIRDSLE